MDLEILLGLLKFWHFKVSLGNHLNWLTFESFKYADTYIVTSLGNIENIRNYTNRWNGSAVPNYMLLSFRPSHPIAKLHPLLFVIMYFNYSFVTVFNMRADVLHPADIVKYLPIYVTPERY